MSEETIREKLLREANARDLPPEEMAELHRTIDEIGQTHDAIEQSFSRAAKTPWPMKPLSERLLNDIGRRLEQLEIQFEEVVHSFIEARNVKRREDAGEIIDE